MQRNKINHNEFQNFTIKYKQKHTTSHKNKKQLEQPLSLPNIQETAQQLHSHRHPRSRYNSLAASETARYTRKQTQSKDQTSNSKTICLRQKGRKPEDNRQLQKVPIEFSDETPWAGLKGRLVYKGHTPKNSYYLMARLKQCQEEEPRWQNISKVYQNDLQFNSSFESGNLEAALRVNKREYWLFMRQDTNSLGLRQWFFFEVVSNRPLNVTFRIYKFNKKYSLYRRGMKPYIKELDQQWAQKGQNVRYDYDTDMKCFYLQFNFDFAEQTKVLIAGMPPYTYSRLTRYLAVLKGNPLVEVSTIGQTLGGIAIPLVSIDGLRRSLSNSEDDKRKAIVIMGRTHPAQTCSNYSIEKIIENILESLTLREVFDFYIIPMVNPDGVIVGNHRTSLTGVDLNRKFTVNFKASDKEMFPEVEAVKGLIKNIVKTHKVELLIDLHGHSAKKNIFAYGQQETIRSNNYLKSRIIPKLLAETITSFRYDHCVFQSYKEKKKTARVYFGKKYGFTTLTIEQSYGLVDRLPISSKDWKAFGSALILVLLQFQRGFMEQYGVMAQKLRTDIQNEQEDKKLIQNSKKAAIISVQDNQGSKSQSITQNRVISKQKDIDTTSQKGLNSEQDAISELESGDQELENTDQGVQLLRTKLHAPYVPNERQSMQLPDTNIQLEQISRPRATIVHEQKTSVVSRIMKMHERSKKSSQLIDILTRKTAKEESKSVRLRIREHKIRLPNIDKFLI